MTQSVGMVKIGDVSSEPFAGRGPGAEAHASDETYRQIDLEVRALVDAAHADAYRALNENRDILDRLAHELLEKETLDQAQLAEIFAEVKKAPKRDVWLADPSRPVSNIPPIEVPERVRPENPEVWEAPLDAPETKPGESEQPPIDPHPIPGNQPPQTGPGEQPGANPGDQQPPWTDR